MKRMEAIVGALLLGAAGAGVFWASPAAAGGGRTCKKCSSLPYLKRALAEQEFLEDAFRQYATDSKMTPPSKCPGERPVDAMVSAVTAADQQFLDGPAGGGRRAIPVNVHPPCGKADDSGRQQIKCTPGKAVAGGAFETGTNCKTVIDVPSCVENATADANGKKGFHLEVKQLPIDSDEGKKEADNRFCDVDRDAMLAHEAQHRKTCDTDHPPDLGDSNAYAMDDAKAYLAGIRSMRQAMHEIAKDCGWHPSQDTKTAQDGDQEYTVPTMKEAKSLAHTLGGKK